MSDYKRKWVKSKESDSSIEVTVAEIDIDYTDSYVAFLDVLGFKEMVYGNSEEDKRKLKEYYNVIGYFKTAVKKIPEKTEIRIMAVSDSVILTMQRKSDEQVQQLRHFCIVIGLIQQHLAMHDIWVRGAVTCGNVVHRPDELLILGPAYIEAYLLEQKAAKYPRVILDASLVDKMDQSTPQDLIEKVNDGVNYSNWKGNVLFDWKKAKMFNVSLAQDVPLFIDYLQKCFEEEGLGTLKLHIARNIGGNIKGKTSVYEKYRWVTDYFLAKFPMFPSEKDSEEAYELLLRL